MNKATIKTISEILTPSISPQERTIIVPNYQRGYKWAVKYNDKESAVEKLLNDIKPYIEQNNDYFLQGITVQEQNNNIILIDGQQRITTLYLLLWCAGGSNAINGIHLKYDIRKKSEEFLYQLAKIDKSESDSSDEDEQDVYYFKQAINQIETFFRNNEGIREKIEKFVKQYIKVIYITIDTMEKAIRTFTMMNGAKASMLDEELVKAEMLRLVSRPLPKEFAVTSSLEGGMEILRDICAEDLNTISLRNKYAREWDKWLYWWNRKDVHDFFNVNTPMGLLLDYMFKRKNNDDKTSFGYEIFTREFLRSGDEITANQKTKHTFKELRHLQKSFEDIYNDSLIYNWLGLSLKCDCSNEKFKIITYFIEHKNDKQLLEQYAIGKMVGATHQEIIKKDNDTNDTDGLCKKKNEFISGVLSPDAYYSHYDACCKFLLYLNIVEENKLNKLQKEKKLQNRKFDFSIWAYRSLEHIFPKSRVYHKDENGTFYRGDNMQCSDAEIAEIQKGNQTWLSREELENLTENKITEHSIGNLVLLYRNNNSEFSNKPFEEKKKTFFNIEDAGFKSRNLLHSISKFAISEWNSEEIVNYYNEMKTQLYKIETNETY
ncbi:MAG: DUF262 domain-containing protein [Bacteroides sp.]|nr:DUF262 domain-containing protein [Bacteroides sp.]